MKLTITFILVFLFNFSSSTHAVNLNSEGIGCGFVNYEYKEPILIGKWRKEFFKFLIGNESIEMKAVGVVLYYLYYPGDNVQLSEYLDQLLELDLNKESYYILKNVCQGSNNFKSTCEKHDFYNRSIKTDSENLNQYDKEFWLVSKPDFNNNELLKKTKKASHLNSYNGYFMSEIKKELEKYFTLNPNPLYQPHPLFENSKVKLSPKEKKETIINNITSQINRLFTRDQSYHYVFEKCESKATESETLLCSYIIDLMINNSDSNFRKKSGYYNQAKIELSNNDNRTTDYKVSNTAKILEAKITLTSSCEANPGNSKLSKKQFQNYKSVHPIYLNAIIKNAKNVGMDKAKHFGYLALKKYLLINKLVKKGSFKDCKNINELTEDDFFNNYKNNTSVKLMLEKYKQIKD